MQENVYAVPESILNDSQVVPVRQMFYVVSKTKFLVLFFCTFGMYSLYWHFKNWKQYKDYHKDRIIPALRAIFSIFFTHSLFSEVDGVLKRSEKKFDWDPTSCASWVGGLCNIRQCNRPDCRIYRRDLACIDRFSSAGCSWPFAFKGADSDQH